MTATSPPRRAQLNWKGTELVVISACESGTGETRAGEGVYGLRRAIAVARARSTLLSIWKVSDDATAAFMEAYYRRLKAGEGRVAALTATQQGFRSHPTPPGGIPMCGLRSSSRGIGGHFRGFEGRHSSLGRNPYAQEGAVPLCWVVQW
jgi:CHAT domain-containing protein